MFIKTMEFKISTYTSCIKINGKPILPPLINDEYKSQIRTWKEEAIRREIQLNANMKNNLHRPRSQSVPYSNEKNSELPNTCIASPCASTRKQLCSPSAAEIVQNNVNENLNGSHEALSTPRVIRSNSYTLDAPSPALLEFLRNQPDFNLNVSYEEPAMSEEESTLVNEGDSVTNKALNLQIYTTIQCNILPEDVCPVLTELDRESSIISETNTIQLEKLLDRQREEQQLLMDSFGKLKSVLMMQIENSQDIEPVEIFSNEQIARIETSTPNTEDQSSQSLYFTFESSETDTLPCKQLLIDFDDNYIINDGNNEKSSRCNYIEDMETLYLSSSSITASKNNSPDTRKDSEMRSNVSNTSRQLFRENNLDLHSPAEQAWAASKICAVVKGYLTRRLLRTERVQILIQTIQESLLCAMELHRENADNIEPADVELHRRLTQQVSAACYAFHEVFFDLTVQEQMSVIASDREHLKEKLLRRRKSDRSV